MNQYLKGFLLLSVLTTISFMPCSAQGNLWGLTSAGGQHRLGVIFKTNTDGTGYEVVKEFKADASGNTPGFSNLTEGPDGLLYGTVPNGGAFNYGVLFQFDPVTQVYTKLVDFNGSDNGRAPRTLTLAPNGSLYGMTTFGGVNDAGILFRYFVGASEVTKILDFDNTISGGLPYGNITVITDEADPDFGKAYGLTSGGGSFGGGVLFELNTWTDQLSLMYEFTTATGSQPYAAPTRAMDGKLYGVTKSGGATNNGVFFEYDIQTDIYTVRHHFNLNSTGAGPQGNLVEVFTGGIVKLFGLAPFGNGVGNGGTLFEYTFSIIEGEMPPTFIKHQDFTFAEGTGLVPYGHLTAAEDGKLYGMASDGGSNSAGTIFRFNPFTSTFSKLVDLTAENGSTPYGSLTLLENGKFYGLTRDGGIKNAGVIFEYIAGSETYSKKHEFSYASNGASPSRTALTVMPSGKLYGTTRTGGAYNNGCLFEFDPSTNKYSKKFDFYYLTSGRTPYGALVPGPNGKLYGVTQGGGAYGLTNTETGGVLFEYDPSTNVFMKKIDFNWATTGDNPLSLALAPNNKLYGLTNNGGDFSGGTLFEYDVETNELIKKHDFKTDTGENPNELAMDHTGKFYGTTSYGGANEKGVIFQYDFITNTYVKKIDFSSEETGAVPSGGLTLAPNGKFYGVTLYGGLNNAGALFEYDADNNIITKKIDFEAASTGSYAATTMILSQNQKLYGLAYNGGANSSGVLFEYDIDTNILVNKRNFEAETGSFPWGSLAYMPCPAPINLAAKEISANSFVANWKAVPGALGYQLDVSTDDFVTFLQGFTNLTLADTSALVTDLSADQLYQYRVRAIGCSPVSSNIIIVRTRTQATSLESAADITQTGFVLSWAGVSGAVEYELDISSDEFETFVTGYNSKKLASLAVTISDLEPGVEYVIRVRAVNSSGPSENSNVVKALTLPDTPTFLPATSVTQVSVTLNWASATSATGYLIDVSTDDFVTFLLELHDRPVEGTSFTVDGLTSGTSYKCRVKAINATGASPYSPSMVQFTLPDVPTGLSASLNEETLFLAGWQPVNGATGYELDVSADDFSTFMSGYESVVVSGINEKFVLGLEKGTLYKFRVRAFNAGGLSGNSEVKTTRTIAENYVAPGITTVASPSPMTLVRGEASGQGGGNLEVKLFHRKISDADFAIKAKTIEASGIVDFDIDSTFFDDLGLEYYFTVKDEIGNDAIGATQFVYRQYTNENSGQLTITAPAKTYSMFSVPLQVPSSRMEDVLQSWFAQFGGYNKTKWRLFHFDGSQYLELGAGLQTFENGKSYWITASEIPSPVTVEGTALAATHADPFTLTFHKGWNQIGSPYPFNIDWEAIRAANPDAGLNTLWAYESEQYVRTTALHAWGGGFVFSDNGGTVKFPVTSQAPASGRRRSDDPFAGKGWQLPLTITVDNMIHSAGVGMHAEASFSKDHFDEVQIPRFFRYLEMNSSHPEFFASKFATDIVPVTNNHTWSFTIEGNVRGSTNVSWKYPAELDPNQLYMVDVTDNLWLNMSRESNYTFKWKDHRKIRIIYQSDPSADLGISMIGTPYPNPFRQSVTVPFLSRQGATVEGVIYDSYGRLIRKISSGSPGLQRHESTSAVPGYGELVWDGTDELSRPVAGGVYIIKVNGQNSRKIIKQ
jgi:uncharacterized repeat protein (TIGR03803 family)